MNAEAARYFQLLEQRVALLGSLATALVFSRAGIVSLDIQGLEQRIQEQEQLCGEIQTVDAQIDRLQRDCSAHFRLASSSTSVANSAPETARLKETLSRLTEVQAVVKKLNAEHRMLLRRSARTVGALLNSYHSFELTYSEPRGSRSTTAGRA